MNNSPKEEKLLVVDGFNVHELICRDNWCVKNIRESYKYFLDCARRQNYKLIVVFDSVTATEETEKKSRKRRQQEVENYSMDAIYNFGIILTESWEILGVEIILPYENDADDVVAAYAHHFRGTVFSRDKDYFRYQECNYEIYNNMIYSQQEIKFSKFEKPKYYRVEPRTIIKDISSIKYYKSAREEKLKKNIEIPRIAGITPLMQLYGSQYHHITELLQTDLFYQKIEQKEFEIADWGFDQDQFVWKKLLIKSSSQFQKLFKKPRATFNYFYHDVRLKDYKSQKVPEVLWYRHVLCLRALVCEMCSVFIDKRWISDIIQDSQMDVPEDFWNKISSWIPDYKCLNLYCYKGKHSFIFSRKDQLYFDEQGRDYPKICKECKKQKFFNNSQWI